MNEPIQMIIVIVIAVYFMVGLSQIISALQMKKKAKKIRFPKKDFFVSVIIPVKELSGTTLENLESTCIQHYPRFEVIFIAEAEEHPAIKVARALERKYPHVKVLLSGNHDPLKTIAKCHNLVCAALHAQGDVLLFGDSDVTYPQDWILKMTSPLGEKINERTIDVVTAPFFIEPDRFFGKFIALSVSLVTFTASATRSNQRFPVYASGASIAVTREVFDELEMIKVWKNTFNDDLVFANEARNRGYHIYNQLAHMNHPNEAFIDIRQTMEKLVRWVVTISKFGHRDLRAEVPLLVGKNLQFQITLIATIILLLTGFPVIFAFAVLVAGYVYAVIFRWLLGIIIEEKDMTPYYPLVPISTTAMILFYVFVRLFYHTFSWEGKTYEVQGRYSN
ncbi:MAG: glycosyltransferase [Methanomassiliicoccales archaeon]|nr:MAG: glycosyltransferase [Methanomassiliicoccales archaeon]